MEPTLPMRLGDSPRTRAKPDQSVAKARPKYGDPRSPILPIHPGASPQAVRHSEGRTKGERRKSESTPKEPRSFFNTEGTEVAERKHPEAIDLGHSGRRSGHLLGGRCGKGSAGGEDKTALTPIAQATTLYTKVAKTAKQILLRWEISLRSLRPSCKSFGCLV
jgi:hypothetical protein